MSDLGICTLHLEEEEWCGKCHLQYCFTCWPEHPKACRTGRLDFHLTDKRIIDNNIQFSKEKSKYQRRPANREYIAIYKAKN